MKIEIEWRSPRFAKFAENIHIRFSRTILENNRSAAPLSEAITSSLLLKLATLSTPI